MNEGASTSNAQRQTANENEAITSDTSDHSLHDSNESAHEEDSNEKWANPWKVQHKNVDITIYYGPNNFYVAQKSEMYVYDCQIRETSLLNFIHDRF